MKIIPTILSLCVLGVFLSGCQKTYKEFPQNIQTTINLSSEGEPISSYVYGMFIEHLGNEDVGDLIDDGLWAEVLDDRKFYYPVDNTLEQQPVNKRDHPNQWFPLCEESTVVMDSTNSFVGVHTPQVLLTGQAECGIYQSNLAIRKGMTYDVRIVLAGTVDAPVTVSLAWGSGEDQLSSFTIEELEENYTTYEFTLAAGEASDSATFSVRSDGKGKLRIGAVSMMPEDNMDGFRADVIPLLKALNSGIYRWGGNMSSGYNWQDGVGHPDKRPPRYDYAWDALENNDVGTHELVRFAELIDVELSLTVNGGLGGPYEAAQWVQYVNGSKDTPVGALRAKNGHPEPFNVKSWCVGNESYGWWQLGSTNLKSHIIKHNQFAEQMKAVDSDIELIGSGATLEEMTITENARRITGNVQAAYGTEADWTGGMLLDAGHNMDYISEHFYCSVTGRFDLEEGTYVDVEEPLVEWTRRPANRIKSKSLHYKYYREHIPGAKDIPVYLDEWAYFTNWVHPTPTLGVTIGYARALHEIFRNSNLITRAGLTFGTSCLSFTDTDVIYNTTGELYKLYSNKMGTIPLTLTGDSPQPEPYWPVGGEQPPVNAGSNTYPLDIFAAKTADGKYITLSIINPTEERQVLSINWSGTGINAERYWTLSGTPDAKNIVGKNPEVQVESGLFEKLSSLDIEPVSINLYRYELIN